MAKKNSPPDPKKGKKARIIANSQYPEFETEYKRTKDQYAKHYPGGVEFVQARGYDELQKAFSEVNPQEDLIMMAHYNRDSMYGVPVSDPTFQTLDAPKGKTIAGLFGDLQGRGYQGNCYMGICEGDNIAQDIQKAGVNVPIFGTPSGKKWYGANPGSKGDFENFFFGVQGKNINKDEYVTSPINPQIGKDYNLNISDRQQELMKRRASGTPVTELSPLPEGKSGIHIKESNKGLLHKNLGVPQGERIPASKLKIKDTDSPAVRKRKQFAINAKKWKHEDGGILGTIDEKLEGMGGIAGTTGNLIQGIQMLGQERQNSCLHLARL